MPLFENVISTAGPDGNVYAIIGLATTLLKEHDVPSDEIIDFRQKCFATHSYGEVLNLVRRYFTIK